MRLKKSKSNFYRSIPGSSPYTILVIHIYIFEESINHFVRNPEKVGT
jgi:hypothetical protein